MNGGMGGWLAGLARWLGLKGKQTGYLRLVLLAVAVGAAMLALGPMLGGNPKGPPNPPPRTAEVTAPATRTAGAGDSLQSDEEALAQRLEATLSHVTGAGRVRVQVSLASGPERIFQVDTTQMTQVTHEKDANGGTRETTQTDQKHQVVVAHQGSGPDAPVMTQLRRPDVAGVMIVAAGARDPRVRQQLAQDAATALHIPVSRITVEEGD